MHGRWLGLIGITGMMAACGTEATGVSDCRAIETARCNAALACGYPNAEECRRAHRDQCLHGLPSDSASAVQIDACVRDIERAGTCAAEQGQSASAEMCDPPIATDVPSRSACDVVLSPERAQACSFLVPVATPAAAATPPVTRSDGGT